jgi:hypothetical protein
MGTDAGTGTGGAIGTGGVASDAGSGIACTDDGGVGLAAVARQCTQDSDCTILTSATCCGADSARGIAKAQANAYAGCFALPSGACSGLGCAKYLGYLTDTGKTTPFQGTGTQPIDLVSVGCLGHLCTTDVVPPADAGQDGPSAVDTAPDVGIQSCGSTTCHSGQACVLRSGGPDPLCQALGDGGCPPGLVYAFNLACPIFTNPAEQAEDGKNTGQGGTIGLECVSGQCMTFVMASGIDAGADVNGGATSSGGAAGSGGTQAGGGVTGTGGSTSASDGSVSTTDLDTCASDADCTSCNWGKAPTDSSQCTGTYCCGGPISSKKRCEASQAAWALYCPNQLPKPIVCPCVDLGCTGEFIGCVGGRCGLWCPPAVDAAGRDGPVY